MKSSCVIPFVFLAVAGCNKSSTDKEMLPAPSSLPPPDVPAIASPSAAPGAASRGESDPFRVTGSLHPRAEAQLGPKTSGVISAISVEEGDTVKKGQLLFRLDSSQARLAVAQAENALSSAKIALASAELDYKRTKELFDRKSVAPATLDQAKTRYDSSKSNVDQAKVGVSQAKTAAGDTSVRSPITGVVTQKLKSVGETATMVPPTIILVVQDVAVLELRAKFPEQALQHLAAGKSLTVTLPSLSLTRTARIKRISPELDSRTRTVEVIAELENKDGTLRAGMLAEVTLGEMTEKPKDPGTAPAKGRTP